MISIWLFVLHISAFMAIGLWVAIYLYRLHYIPKQFIIVAAFAVICLLYYAVFFACLLSPRLGRWFDFCLHGFGWTVLVYSVYRFRKSFKSTTLRYFIALPLALIILTTSFYSVVLSGCQIPTAGLSEDNSAFCHINFLPGDNALPYLYAKKVAEKRSNDLISDWRLVDRPPVQIGAALSALHLHGGDPAARSPETYKAYQLIATFLQLSWIAAIFGFLFTIGISLRKTVLSLGALSMVGFLYLNSIFVWPKFLASSIVLMGCVLLLDTSYKYYKRTSATAITALAMGLLIHDGVLFTILSVLAVYLYLILRLRSHTGKKARKNPISLRSLFVGAAAAIVLLAPWGIYKQFHSGPDRLIKWHLAGVVIPDNRSTTRTILDSYKALSFKTWYQGRKENIKMLYTPMQKEEVAYGFRDLGISRVSIKKSLGHFSAFQQRNDFFIVFYAIGIFNLGWVALLFRKSRSQLSQIEKNLLLATLLNIVVWVVVMFIPLSTVIHQGSYATMLILLGVLTAWIARANLAILLFTAQFLIFNILWVIGSFARFNLSLSGAIPALISSFVVSFIYLYLYKKLPDLEAKLS